MDGFQRKAINVTDQKAQRGIRRWVKKHTILTIGIIVVGLLFFKGFVGAASMGNPFSLKHIAVSSVSNGVETDAQGHTNILLVGVGGEGHDGENLTDTMIIASVDRKNGLVPMLSIPRDFFVENEVVGWGTRINGVYEYIYDDTGDSEFAMSELIGELETITEIPIHYYAKIDFQGFEDIVDAIGGVDVTLEEDLYDPFYPAPPGVGYLQEIFYLEAGDHTLDGETALKFARSRYTTSDFDRARRQQELINSIRQKAMSVGFLLNPGKIKNTIEAISNNFETDLTMAEMLHLASLAGDFDGSSILSEVYNDEAYRTGGFLYTPEREAYGGAFVLVPFSEDLIELQTFAQLYFYESQLFVDQVPIQVLNGTGTESLAGLTKMHLTRYGLNVVDAGNAASKDVEKTQIYYYPQVESEDEEAVVYELDQTLDIIGSLLTTGQVSEATEEYSEENWDSDDAEIVIVLGEDFVEYYTEHEERFYIGFYN